MRTLAGLRILSTQISSRPSFLNGLRKSPHVKHITRIEAIGPGNWSWCHLLNHRQFRTTAVPLSSKDYYKILGVSQDSKAKDIKKAYYQLAKKFHPDTNKGDKEAQRKFQEVSEAYECLSDDNKRKQYDTFGSEGPGAAGGGPFGGAGFPGAGSTGGWNFKSNIDPEELFRTIFGDQSFRTSQFGDNPFDFSNVHQQPSEYKMKVDFLEAAKGVEKEMSFHIMDSCPTCSGSGNEPGTSADRCQQCNGTGMETVSTGPFMMRSTCRRCYGKGFFNKHPCFDCRGSGQTKAKKKIKVPV